MNLFEYVWPAKLFCIFAQTLHVFFLIGKSFSKDRMERHHKVCTMLAPPALIPVQQYRYCPVEAKSTFGSLFEYTMVRMQFLPIGPKSLANGLFSLRVWFLEAM